MSRVLVSAMLAGWLSTGAFAQPAAPMRMAPGSGMSGDTIRVQVGVNLFIPGPSGDNEEGAKSRERARRMLYEMAVKECTLLRDTLASDCRIENLSINLSRHQGGPEGFNAGGTFSYRITVK